MAEGLRSATCELLSTQPNMFLGLPRKVFGAIVFPTLFVLLLVQDWKQAVAVVATAGAVYAAVRRGVSEDLWAFDIWLRSIPTDWRFLCADKWGGARCDPLPERPLLPLGGGSVALRRAL